MILLLYSWNANNERVLADNLSKAGFEVIWFRKVCRHYTRDMDLAMEMIPFIHAQKTEAVVSFNYFPIISMICNTCRIPYYAWVYDCPHFTLYAKQISLPCNHIGIFDREMVRQMEGYGINTAYHVPLAADTAYFDQVIAQASRQEKEKYQCDVSFVGSLYTGEYNYYDTLFHADHAKHNTDTKYRNGQGPIAPEGIKTINDAVIDKQCFSYHRDWMRMSVADGSIDLHGIQEEMEKQGLMLGEDYFANPEDILLAAVLEKKVTVEERRILLTEAVKRFADKDGGAKAEKKHDFRLYTGSDTEELPELNPYNQGMVDYSTQMPLVFSGSKINLNISLRSIHSGIPLRVLDIMACGGFVLSNWQPEIADNFEEGVEIVTFDSLGECLDKIAYYLNHEEERKRIARNGQSAVQEGFSYKIGFERLFC